MSTYRHGSTTRPAPVESVEQARRRNAAAHAELAALHADTAAVLAKIHADTQATRAAIDKAADKHLTEIAEAQAIAAARLTAARAALTRTINATQAARTQADEIAKLAPVVQLRPNRYGGTDGLLAAADEIRDHDRRQRAA